MGFVNRNQTLFQHTNNFAVQHSVHIMLLKKVGNVDSHISENNKSQNSTIYLGGEREWLLDRGLERDRLLERECDRDLEWEYRNRVLNLVCQVCEYNKTFRTQVLQYILQET